MLVTSNSVVTVVLSVFAPLNVVLPVTVSVAAAGVAVMNEPMFVMPLIGYGNYLLM